jgi:hypothetical protein
MDNITGKDSWGINSRPGRRHTLAAGIMACLLILFTVFGYRSGQWGFYCWAIFVPFFLVEWFKFGEKPTMHLNKWAVRGLLCFALCLILASLIVGDRKSLSKGFGYIMYSVPFLMMLYLYQHFDIKMWVKGAIGASIVVLCVYGLYEWDARSLKLMTSIYDQHNTFGMTMEILIPFAAMYAWDAKKYTEKAVWLILAVLGLVCVYLSHSRGAILGLASGTAGAAVVLSILTAGRNWKKIILVLCVSAGVLAAGWGMVGHINELRGSSDGGERIIMLESSYNMWKDHKLAGVGLANWKKNYYGPYRPAGQHEQGLNMPHNMFAFFASTSGIIGLVGYIGYLLLTFIGICQDFIKTHRKSCYAAGMVMFLAITAHGMVDGTLISEKTARVYFALMAFMAVYPLEKLAGRNEKTEDSGAGKP